MKRFRRFRRAHLNLVGICFFKQFCDCGAFFKREVSFGVARSGVVFLAGVEHGEYGETVTCGGANLLNLLGRDSGSIFQRLGPVSSSCVLFFRLRSWLEMSMVAALVSTPSKPVCFSLRAQLSYDWKNSSRNSFDFLATSLSRFKRKARSARLEVWCGCHESHQGIGVPTASSAERLPPHA